MSHMYMYMYVRERRDATMQGGKVDLLFNYEVKYIH